MNYDVFICYSSKDKGIANDICSLLENNGVTCWIAPRNVKPGSHYGEEIVDAIESSLSLLLVLSENSNQSLHVRNEIEMGVSRGKVIFPVLIRNVQPSKALVFYIQATQWLEAWIPPLEQKINELTETIKTLPGWKAKAYSDPACVPDKVIVKEDKNDASSPVVIKKQTTDLPKKLDELNIILSNQLEQHFFDEAGITVSEILKIDKDNKDALNAQALIDKMHGLGNIGCFKGPGVGVESFFTRNGQKIIACFDGIGGKSASARPPTINIWDVNSRQKLFEFLISRPFKPTCLALSPDEKTFLMGDLSGIYLINISSKKITADYPAGWIRSVSFLPDRNQAITGGNELLLWDFDLGSTIYRFPGHTGRIQCLAVTTDGTKAVTGGEDATIRLWDIQKKKELWRKEGFKVNFQSIAISSDGSKILAGGNKVIRLIDSNTGNDLLTFEGHKGYTISLAISPDGQSALSGGTDNILRLWDMKTGYQARGYTISGSWTGSVWFSPDGNKAVSTDIGNVNIWALP